MFYHCEGPDAEIVKNKTQCLELSGNGNKWVNHKYNFDNLGQALMSLFVLSSKDGWVNIMYSGLDAVGIDQQVLLLVVFILKTQKQHVLGTYILHLFIRVINVC